MATSPEGPVSSSIGNRGATDVTGSRRYVRSMTARLLMFALAATILMSCATQQHQVDLADAKSGRLHARPGIVTAPSDATGIQKLNLAVGRDGVIYVPAKHGSPAPLILTLHGFGESGEFMLRRVQQLADRIGAIVVAPDARAKTWDVASGPIDDKAIDRLGTDVAFIDRALARVFERYAIDPRRIAIAGFSDGGGYALSLGIMNGDLFTHVIAFSPCYLRVREAAGHPRILLAHGTSDDTLPIEQCGRKIARGLTDAGYDLQYMEFDGEHVVNEQIARQALTSWFVHAG
jgi:phospholipase/carboxylesterase